MDGICRDLNVIRRISRGRREQTNQMFKWRVLLYAAIGRTASSHPLSTETSTGCFVHPCCCTAL
jgi:hypothetical protein